MKDELVFSSEREINLQALQNKLWNFVDMSRQGNIEAVRACLKDQDVKDYIDYEDCLAFRYAVGYGYIEIMKLLLEYFKIFKHLTDHRNEILIIAIQNNQLQAAQLLLSFSQVREYMVNNVHEPLQVANRSSCSEEMRAYIHHMNASMSGSKSKKRGYAETVAVVDNSSMDIDEENIEVQRIKRKC